MSLRSQSAPTPAPYFPAPLLPAALAKRKITTAVYHFLQMSPRVFLPLMVTILQNRLVSSWNRKKTRQSIVLFVFSREYYRIYR